MKSVASRNESDELVQGILRGEVRAIARAITAVEQELPSARRILSGLYPSTGKAYRVGITGPPGAGKSTLLERLALECRARHLTVGILSVDPSSPFTGGALLGDRVRMGQAVHQPGVYMRSMATRGVLGGLAQTTMEAADILDASGKAFVFIETVGVGQSELEVARACDVTVVVLVPESGGALQAMKAGLMEVADILVVNKADRPGADHLVADLLEYVDIQGGRDLLRPGFSADGAGESHWRIPVVQTVATDGTGTSNLLDTILSYRTALEMWNAWGEKRLRQARSKIRELVTAHLEKAIWEDPRNSDLLQRMAEKLVAGRMDPLTASEDFLKKIMSRWQV